MKNQKKADYSYGEA